jgi:S1-C subfamily serine protease
MHVYSASGQLTGTGSAVAIGASTIITNCHVLVGGVRAELHIGGQRMATQLQVADQELDLCRMQVAGTLRPVPLGSVSDVHNNLPVFAIGAPGGGPVIITEGVVTTLHGIRAGNVIQTTAAVSPGSSGGGLFTANGKLVGIVTFQQRGPEQRNYAIPVDWINRMETREGSGQADEVIPPVYFN